MSASPDALYSSNNHDNNGAFNFERFHKLKNGVKNETSVNNLDEKQSPASVWAMDCEDGLTVLGCANGRIEIWETMSCQFKVSNFFPPLKCHALSIICPQVL